MRFDSETRLYPRVLTKAVLLFLGFLSTSSLHSAARFSLPSVLIVRQQFNERFAWMVGFSLAPTPAVWMPATKVLTDSLAGLLSAEILAALIFLRGAGDVLSC